jgi:8-oxo-dGTP pyrophosphatase MutT (NUDIX family)
MEQRSVLSFGKPESDSLTAEQVIARFEVAPPPGLRRSNDARSRGDHDLNPDMYPGATLTSAAVLVPIVTRPEGLTVLFTLRTSNLSAHAGQISFPGGRVDPADRDESRAALREAEEEIGLEPSKVRLIGRLDTYLTRTGFRIHPAVGLVSPPLALRPDPREVAEIFEAPLDFIIDPGNRRCDSRIYRDRERFFWAIPFGQRYIWGATAGMLVNLSELLWSGH